MNGYILLAGGLLMMAIDKTSEVSDPETAAALVLIVLGISALWAKE